MRYILLLLLTLNLFAVDATLTIEKDVEARSRIALVDGSALPQSKLSAILRSDLKISGHFLPDSTIHKGAFGERFIPPALKSKEYLLRYRLSQTKGVKLEVRLQRASDGTILFKKHYAIGDRRKTPFLVHKAVSDINDALKYPDISWINRYVVYARYTLPRKSEIVLADYTFNYQKVIIRGGLNLFPKWADKAQKSFYYTSYRGVLPTLYRVNIYTGAKQRVVASEGMLVCTDVSRDGSRLLLTMAPNGQADIYELNLRTHAKKRITKFSGIDVGGKYINNESQVLFVSSRLGYANIFKKPLGSSAVSQVVHHGRNNNACDTHGNQIVYSSRESNHAFASNTFNLYLSLANGSGTRPLTTTGANQFPRFSTDGSVILFIKHTQRGSAIGYTNLMSRQSLLFPISGRKIQSIDW